VKNALKIFGFTFVVVAFYSYVGHWVPQKETYPPKTLEIRADLTTDEMVEIGQQIVAGKGTCLGCHTIGSEGGALRFPDLAGVGARAKSREEGHTDIDYLSEALYEPNAFIVPGFQPGMPTINKPPIGLTDQEILTVIAYLESLGGTPTVTMDTKLKWQGQTPAAPTPAAAPGAKMDGPTIVQTYLCVTCHNFADASHTVGPSLYDVGDRLTKAQLYEAVMDPDATIAKGFPAGVMPATLGASGFYDKISTQNLKTLVEYLASLKGH